MVEVITIGKRTLEYNPTIEGIKETYPDDFLLLETMFTWDVPKATNEMKKIGEIDDRLIIIDGPGWRNLGNDGYFDLDLLPDMRSYVPADQKVQITKITEGCPNDCSFCYSGRFKILGIPTIKRNHVKLTDENLLAHPNIDFILTRLSDFRVDNKVVNYEAICGFEKKLVTKEIAEMLKAARFKKVRFAWDEPFNDKSQKLAKVTVDNFVSAGYNPKSISIFVLTNWKVSIDDCIKKLDLMKVWNVKINDCCFNCNHSDPIPDGWTIEEIKEFRKKARQHNQIVNFRIFPEEWRKSND